MQTLFLRDGKGILPALLLTLAGAWLYAGGASSDPNPPPTPTVVVSAGRPGGDVDDPVACRVSASVQNPPTPSAEATLVPHWKWSVGSVSYSVTGKEGTFGGGGSYHDLSITLKKDAQGNTDDTHPDAKFTGTFDTGGWYQVQATATVTYHDTGTKKDLTPISGTGVIGDPDDDSSSSSVSGSGSGAGNNGAQPMAVHAEAVPDPNQPDGKHDGFYIRRDGVIIKGFNETSYHKGGTSKHPTPVKDKRNLDGSISTTAAASFGVFHVNKMLPPSKQVKGWYASGSFNTVPSDFDTYVWSHPKSNVADGYGDGTSSIHYNFVFTGGFPSQNTVNVDVYKGSKKYSNSYSVTWHYPVEAQHRVSRSPNYKEQLTKLLGPIGPGASEITVPEQPAHEYDISEGVKGIGTIVSLIPGGDDVAPIIDIVGSAIGFANFKESLPAIPQTSVGNDPGLWLATQTRTDYKQNVAPDARFLLKYANGYTKTKMEYWVVLYYHREVWNADVYGTNGYKNNGNFGILPADGMPEEEPYYSYYPDRGPTM